MKWVGMGRRGTRNTSNVHKQLSNRNKAHNGDAMRLKSKRSNTVTPPPSSKQRAPIATASPSPSPQLTQSTENTSKCIDTNSVDSQQRYRMIQPPPFAKTIASFDEGDSKSLPNLPTMAVQPSAPLGLGLSTRVSIDDDEIVGQPSRSRSPSIKSYPPPPYKPKSVPQGSHRQMVQDALNVVVELEIKSAASSKQPEQARRRSPSNDTNKTSPSKGYKQASKFPGCSASVYSSSSQTTNVSHASIKKKIRKNAWQGKNQRPTDSGNNTSTKKSKSSTNSRKYKKKKHKRTKSRNDDDDDASQGSHASYSSMISATYHRIKGYMGYKSKHTTTRQQASGRKKDPKYRSKKFKPAATGSRVSARNVTTAASTNMSPQRVSSSNHAAGSVQNAGTPGVSGAFSCPDIGNTDCKLQIPSSILRTASAVSLNGRDNFKEEKEEKDEQTEYHESLREIMGVVTKNTTPSLYPSPEHSIKMATRCNKDITTKMYQCPSLSRNCSDGTTQILDLPWKDSTPGSRLQGLYSGPVCVQPHGKGTLILDGNMKFHGSWVNGELVSPLVSDEDEKKKTQSQEDCKSFSKYEESYTRASSDYAEETYEYYSNDNKSDDYTTLTVSTQYNPKKTAETSIDRKSPAKSIIEKSSFNGSSTSCTRRSSLTSVVSEYSNHEDGSPSQRLKYRLGEIARTPRDMVIFRSNEEGIESASLLKKHDRAFLKRSNGLWTCAVVADRSFQPSNARGIRSNWLSEDDINNIKTEEMVESILFVINEDGATKIVKRKHWGKFIRRIQTADEKSNDGSVGSMPR